MKQTFLLLSAACLAAPLARADLIAFRVGRADTVAKGVIEHAVILVEDGKIVTIGEDLPIERGIAIVDKPEWTVIPGLVNCYTRIGCDSEGGDDMNPEAKASDELYAQADEFDEVVKFGETTLGIYPAGNGIPGQAVAVRPQAESGPAMVLQDPAYLKIIVRADSGSKKRITDGFKKADDYDEKVKKAREKWEKDQEKKKGKKDDKKDEKKDEKSDEKKSAFEDPKPDEKDSAKKDEGKDGFVPPAPDDKVAPFLALRAKSLRALVSVGGAAEYLHWLDALGKEDILWDLRCVMNRDSDLFYVLTKKEYDLDQDGIGDKKLRVVMEPQLSLTPGTMRTRNLALELSNAGAKIVFIPRGDAVSEHRDWFASVGEMVGAGLSREIALRAMTLEPAELMGIADRVGSLEKGKDANMVFLNGDPFEPTTRIQAVMLEGKIVHGEVNQ